MEAVQLVMWDRPPNHRCPVLRIAGLGRARQPNHGRVRLLHRTMQHAGIFGAAMEAIPTGNILDVVYRGWHVHHLLEFC